MRLGNRIFLILVFLIISKNYLIAEDKITTSPLINIEKIKPSFETLEDGTIFAYKVTNFYNKEKL